MSTGVSGLEFLRVAVKNCTKLESFSYHSVSTEIFTYDLIAKLLKNNRKLSVLTLSQGIRNLQLPTCKAIVEHGSNLEYICRFNDRVFSSVT